MDKTAETQDLKLRLAEAEEALRTRIAAEDAIRRDRDEALAALIEERQRANPANNPAALHENQEKYRSLFESINEGFTIAETIRGTDGRVSDLIYREANAAYARQAGFQPYPGLRLKEIAPQIEQDWLDFYDRVSSTGVSETKESFNADMRRWYRTQCSRVGPAGSKLLGFVFEDVTDRKRADAVLRDSEKRQAFLLRLTDAIRSELSEQAVIERAVQMLADELALDRCYVTKLYPAEDLTEVAHEVRGPGLEPIPSSLRNSDFPEAYKQTFDRTLIFEDTATDPRLTETDRLALGSMSFGALLSRPLRRDGSPIFAVGAVSSQPRRWTPSEIALVEEVTERTWEAAERARTESTLRESAERLSLAIEIGALASWDWDVKSNAVTWNDRHFLMQGYGVDEVIPSFEAWAARIHPDDRDETLALLAKARDERLVYAHDFRSLRSDGRIVWCSARGRFFYGADGQPYRMIGVMEDVTERTASEAALCESEARFRQFGKASRSAIWVRDAQTFAFEYVSPSVEDIYGIAPERLMEDERLLGATILPEEREGVSEKVQRISNGETVVQEYRILRASDRAFRWIRSTGFPIHDGDNEIRRIGAIAEDVTDERIAVEHQGVLIGELQHRVRNLMAMIRSMANRSSEGPSSIEGYRSALEGRLLALARVQALLTRTGNEGGLLRNVIEAEIAAQAHHAGQYDLTGPDILLSPKAVEVLTLAFHELATNALRYGGLSTTSGRVSVQWSTVDRHGAPWLVLDWIEEGVPYREPTTRRGFGSELIERKVPYELRGTGKVTIKDGQARCHLEVPLTGGDSILETDAPTPVTIHGGSLDMTDAPDLSGQTVLVVEDDYFMASDVASALRRAGAEVLGPCPTEEAATSLLGTQTPSSVVLDLNLGGGGPNFGLARLLRERGIPFLFVTGYDPDVIPDNMLDVPRLQKPIPMRQIVDAFGRL